MKQANRRLVRRFARNLIATIAVTAIFAITAVDPAGPATANGVRVAAR